MKTIHRVLTALMAVFTLLAAPASAWAQVTITNATFDTPNTSSYSYTTPTGWTSSGYAGVSNGTWHGSGFGVVGGSTGQFAYLQAGAGPSNISQNVAFPTAGTYQLTYMLAGRASDSGGYGDCTYTTTIGSGGSILSVSGNTTSNQPFTTQSHTFTVASAGTYALTFTNTTPSGLDAFYVDTVAITSVVSAPTVTTSPASGVASTSATLNGTVNAGGSSTTVTFQYGTTTSYGQTATATQSPVSGTSDTAVSAVIGGLSANTTYHYCVVGANSSGTSTGSNQTFTTDGPPAAGDFKILTLTANNYTAIEAVSSTGDDRGGIALSPSRVFLTGDNATGSFARADLSGGTQTIQKDALCANLADDTVYVLADGSGQFVRGIHNTGVTQLTRLIQVDGSTGALTGTSVTLSTPIMGWGSTQRGIFSGYNRVVVLLGGIAFQIALPSGTVTNLGSVTLPIYNSTENDYGPFGVAERFAGADWLAYGTSTAIMRTRIGSSATQTVASFPDGLQDLASFTISPSTNRWYFHYEGSSGHFGSRDETLGFADATFSIVPVTTAPVVTTGSTTSVASTSATLNGTVNAGGANTTVTFQYGTTTSYGSTATAAQSPVSGSSNTVVSAAISGLAAHTLYHYRVVGVNSAGTTHGSDATFTTANTNPTAPNAATTGTTGDQRTYTLSFPATDADGDAVAITAATSGTGVTVNSFTGTSVTFTPASNFTGNGSFTYTVGDGFGGTATGTITVAVTDNDPPSKPVFTQATRGYTASTSAYFVFDSTDNVGPVTYEAIVNEPPSGPVSSPLTLTGLAPGGYAITVRARDAAGNTSVWSNAPTWLVQYPLTLVANNASREYGAANPAFTGTISGVQGSYAAVTPSWTTSATSTSGVGTYPLVGAISGADAFRYYIQTNTTGTLTITPATTGTSVADRSVVFSNSAQNVVLSAAVTGAGASLVSGGTVTFQLKNGAANVGTAVTSSNVVAGAVGVTYILPAGTAVGPYTIQATYNGTSTLATSTSTGTLTVIPPPPVAALVLNGFPNPATAGTAGSFTVRAYDSLGASLPSYTGTVTFSSSDATAALPASYTFVPGDNGVKTFSATLRRTGTHTITVTDAANAVGGIQSGIVVNPRPGGAAGKSYAWGYNSGGALGTGDTINRSLPTLLSGFDGTIAVAGGYLASYAVKPDGSAWAWGYNGNGQLGDGTTNSRSTPAQVRGPGGIGFLGNVTAISGLYHALALKDDGTVWAWGDRGGLTPRQVRGVSPGTFLTGVTAISAGGDFSLALRADKTVVRWQPGGNPVVVAGLTDIKAISAGERHGMALGEDGRVWTWGDNYYGQLGDGTTTPRATPVSIPGLTNVKGLAAGLRHSVAVKEDGTVWTWGFNFGGSLGNGFSSGNQSSPVQVRDAKGFLTNVASVAGGVYHCFARKNDGSLWGWGHGGSGVLGTGSTSSSSVAVKVGTLSSASIVAQGASSFHALAVEEGGASATQFLVTAPTGVAAGTPFDVTVRALDAAGNSVAHVGTVRFTSNDALAGLPANYTFVAGDKGEKTFSVTLHTAGTRRVTVAAATSKTLSGAVNVEVQAGGSTTITETVAAAFNAADQFVTVTARVTGSGTVSQGVVTFQMKTSGGTDIGAPVFAAVSNGVATASYVVPGGTPAAIYPLHASYSGGASFAASNGSGGNLRLGQAPTNMQTIASAATAPYSLASQSVTLSAAVISSAGTVNEGTISFRVLDSGGEVIESVTTSAPLTTGSGSVSYLLPPALDAGDYTIETSYSGGVNFEASANTATLSVTPAVSTVAATLAQADYSTAAQTVTLNATVTSAAGTLNEGVVEFQVKTTGGTNVGAAVTSEVVADGEASVIYTLPVGTPEGDYTIASHYVGAPNLADSTDETQTLTVLYLPETTITEVPAKTVDASATAQSVTLEATVSAQSSDPVNEGTVTFRVLYEGDEVGTPVTSGTVSGGAVSASYNLPAGAAPGDYTIEASYSGTANYVTSSALGALTVRGLPVVAVDGAGATPASLIFTMTGSLAGARYEHSATLLPDGQVLVAGGSNSSNLNTCEIYHPVTGTWSAAAAMPGAREGHAAILLATGKVLVVGGNNSGAALATAWLFDPAAGTWAATGSLATARVNPAVTLLANGKVLVTGGRNGPHFNSAELYDPATGTWSPAGTMGTARFQHSATLLADGRVLVAGGESATNAYLNLAELYDPTTNTWVPTGSFTGARREHAATRLSNGTVLIAGGYAGAGVLASCALYDPATGTWTATGSMNAGRSPQIQTLLPTGNVLVTSGSFNTAACEIYNAATGTWADAGALAETRRRHATLVLASGKVLVIGGDSLNGKRTSVELSNIPAVVFTAVEGSPGIRTGTFSDPDGNETVTLSASTGAITQDNDAGTWSWSPAAGFDGPSSQTVTITATDVTDITATASFTFTVTNVAPTIVITAPETALPGESVDFSFTATDPSATDQAAGFMFAISYGDGSPQEPGATQLLPSPRLRGHVFASPGAYTVTCTATDQDGGVSLLASKMITILSPEIVVFKGAVTDTELTDNTGTQDFGSVAVGSSSTAQTITLRNDGTGNLTGIAVTKAVTGNPGDFTVNTAGMLTTLAPNATTTFTVAFSPTAGGARSAVVQIASNDADENPFEINVSGIGALLPEAVTLQASPVRNYTATLHGTVNPNHGTTTVWFEYSTDSTMTSGLHSTAVQSAGTGAAVLPFSAAITELLADSGYFARIVAQNEAGRTDGPVTSFHTLPPVVTDEFMNTDSGLVGGGRIYRPLSGVINQQGRVSFEATGKVGTGGITSDSSALLLSDASGSIRVVARKGAIVQTAPWQTLAGLFNHLVLTDAGQSVALDRVSGAPTTTDYTYITSRAGFDVEILSREGDSAPSSGEFKTHTGKPAADALGRVYFSGDLTGTGVTTKNDSGIYQESGGTLVEIAREGDDVSALTGDPAWLGGVGAMVPAAGDGVAFTALLQNNPADAKQKTSTAHNALVLAGNESGLQILARKGDVVPDTGGATMKSFSGVSRGAHDSHAFLGLMNTGAGVTTANDQVLVAVTSTGSHLVAREGVTVVDGVTLMKFAEFYATSSGEVVYEASGVLCRWSEAGGVEVLARIGGAAAGTGSTHSALSALSVSEGGAVALLSKLANGASVLWRALPGQALTPVTSTGDPVTLDGMNYPLLAITLHSSGAGTGGGGGGMGSGINDLGEIFAVLSIGGGKYVARIFR